MDGTRAHVSHKLLAVLRQIKETPGAALHISSTVGWQTRAGTGGIVATLPIRFIRRPNRRDMQAGIYPIVRHPKIDGLEFRLIGPRAPLPEAERLSDLEMAVHPDDWDRVREAVGFEPPVGRIYGCTICGGERLGEGLPTVLPTIVDPRDNCVYCANACSPECVEEAAKKVRTLLRQAVRRETHPTNEQANGPSVTFGNKK